jgi:putative ribosome biogenesis GTPase RsgA
MKSNKKMTQIMNTEENTHDAFEDILNLSADCKFTNCTHDPEPECAVKEAILEGFLPEERLTTYLREKNEAAYVANEKNKTKAIDYMKQRKLFRNERGCKP